MNKEAWAIDFRGQTDKVLACRCFPPWLNMLISVRGLMNLLDDKQTW